MKQNFDADAIKQAIAEIMSGPEDSEDTASIKTFYTASSIPYMERQMWRKIERALRGRFTAEFVRDNYALIVDTVEETVWENSIPRRGDTTTPAQIVAIESALASTKTPTSYRSDRLSTLAGVIDEGAEGTAMASQTERRVSDLPLAQHIPEMGEYGPSASWKVPPNSPIISLDSNFYEDILDFPVPLRHTHGSLSSTSSVTSPRFTRILFPQSRYKKFLRTIDISFQDKSIRKWSVYVIGTVLFDIQCDDNLFTSRFLNESCVEWQHCEDYTSSSEISGTEMNFLGEVQGRWHVVKSSDRDNLRPNYEITTFKVIDCP
ncbi:hypothetical protein COCCADRAFT_6558 [Bipolaris zeicola 26-R-13]|uniref:Uncharacterized protein n=1 Tax=Cochliobolus carbonum (strain 26-R-13) TaxID=930089 RepID=W6Y0R5_COCC2|nr:uncharacterized protein COCCADRAFT_6558 [Bipolaris zeicola 26-R-13]EUC31573.1 hypothetical protein COCCADRAFT_6558 [Bipolaris zeicola 26-R-13]